MTAISDIAGAENKRLDGKRILILFPHIVTSGGALNYTLRLAEQLRMRAATVAILVLKADPADIPLPAGVEIISLNGPLTSKLGYWLFLPYWQRKINQAVINWKPDLLVPQVFPSNWWGWLYKKKYQDVKLVWVCHEPSAFIHSMPWIRAIRPKWMSIFALFIRPLLAYVDVSLAQQSDRTIANSQFTATEMRRVYDFLPEVIAYPGIDFGLFDKSDRLEERAIVTVARLTRFKRIDFLLEVFAGLLMTHPDLKYHIVGTGEEAASLRHLVSKMGLESRVVFHGAVTDEKLYTLYRKSSLFLHGSINEPFGMAPLEAIACGTPVVAHCSGGPKEFVDENCGRLILSLNVPDWVDEIAAYLDYLSTSSDQHEKVRESARRFEWHATLEPAVEAIGRMCNE